MSGYILDLRKTVGHRPLLQVGASVIVTDPAGRILLQLRRDCRCWGYAGGSVELDEAAQDAARRELKEETGLTAETLTLFGVFSGKDNHDVYPNGDEVSNVDVVYLCDRYTGELRCQPEEVEALRFFATDEVPDNLFPPCKKACSPALPGGRQPAEGSSIRRTAPQAAQKTANENGRTP